MKHRATQHLGTDLVPPGHKHLKVAALFGQSLLTKEMQGFTTLPAQPVAQANVPKGPRLLPLSDFRLVLIQ